MDEIKEFLLISRRKDVQHIKVKKSSGKGKKGVTKFKVRCSKYLYTLRIDQPEKADKLRKSLPPTVKVVDVK